MNGVNRKSKNKFDFLAVISDENTAKVVKKIKEKLEGILSEKQFTNVQYNIKVVDNLTIDKNTGKFKLILQENK